MKIFARRAALPLIALVACSEPFDPNLVTAVAIQPTAVAVESFGDTLRLTATLTNGHGAPVTGKTLRWLSSTPAIASVDTTGLVTAVGNGNATVTAAVDGARGVTAVSVNQKVTAVFVAPMSDTLVSLNETTQLTVEARDARGHAVVGRPATWGSSNAGVASVTTAGLVRALANGPTTITAMVDATADSAEILVQQRPTQLAFRVHPRMTLETATLTPAIEVGLLDALGSVVTPSTESVTLSVTPAAGALAGTTQIAAAGGVATYSDVSLTNAGVAYRLTAASGALTPDTSDAFEVRIRFATMSSGHVHTCGVNTGGVAFCWGDGSVGRLGTGDTNSTNVPRAVAGGHVFTTVRANAGHSCGLVSGGAAYCWGSNSIGQLGNGSSGMDSFVPIPVAGNLSFTSIVVAGHSCARTAGGAAYCWGRNESGQLGTGDNSSSNVPVSVSGGLTFIALSAGSAHTCGVASNGIAYCWGNNPDGQLGNNSTSPSTAPTPVTGTLTFSTVSAGGDHSCGLTTSGAAYCWGAGAQGQLGDSTGTSSTVPVAVRGGHQFASITASGFASSGGAHTCAVTAGGVAYCWGATGLGNASVTASTTPVPVAGGLTFASVSGGGFHTCGVVTTGVGYCWGGQTSGQLGTGQNVSSFVPAPVVAPRP